ncbi:VanW family protein [Sporosarcina sp. ACRSL]|uniref:VanW family protein n=1 Tax=Sporosarcina sp. ACRSL TaxID=2918215 RepID=UPI001EF56261|nr:VanW family protein [Sporosarcina sp. ACRSL]
MNRKIVSISLSSILLLFLFTGVALASDFRFGKHYTDHTYVGPFNISNHKTNQAKSKLASDFSELQTKLEVNLIYQDTQFSLPPETIKFDIDMTLANASSGEDNPIIATVSRDGLRTVLSQQLPQIRFTEGAVDSVAAGIEEELQTGIMPRNVHITDYIENEIPFEVVASSENSIDTISPSLSKAIQTLDDVAIEPYESFSMLELLTNSEVGPLTDEEMTFLSSILYTAILQTNFQIAERNISTTISPFIQPGFEASMNQTLGLDFKFTNPNKTDFTIRSAWSAGAIHLSIEGRPFYYSYEPSTTNIETYKPRTMRQYSAFIDDGQVVVSQEGKEGIEAIVQRTRSVDGQVVDTEQISEDFYAPIHRIEVHPLVKGNASQTTDAENVETGLPQSGGSQTATGYESSNADEIDADGSNAINGYNNQESTEEIIYDKSGLPISGK